MDKEYFNVLIALVGPLLGFGVSWLLQLISHRQRIKEARLGRLRERQAEVVAKLSESLYTVETTWRRLQDVDLVDDSERKVIIKDMLESKKRLRDDFNNNRLWINESLCEEIDAIFSNLRNCTRNYKLSSLSGGPMSPEDKEKAWQSVCGTVNVEIPRMRKRLEDRFRAFVGAV
jgi:hypothetical protein